MTAAYHPAAAELDAIRRDPTCEFQSVDGPECGEPAVTVAVTKTGQLYPLCIRCAACLVSHADFTGHDTPRFIHLFDLMGEPQ